MCHSSLMLCFSPFAKTVQYLLRSSWKRKTGRGFRIGIGAPTVRVQVVKVKTSIGPGTKMLSSLGAFRHRRRRMTRERGWYGIGSRGTSASAAHTTREGRSRAAARIASMVSLSPRHRLVRSMRCDSRLVGPAGFWGVTNGPSGRRRNPMRCCGCGSPPRRMRSLRGES